MTVRSVKSKKYPHIEFMDLQQNGVLIECAVMRRDRAGNVLFIPLQELDNIDRQRIARIVTSRNANTFELWDLMAQTTLGNGMNALSYFHQLVKQLTPSGQIMKPTVGRIGAPVPATN